MNISGYLVFPPLDLRQEYRYDFMTKLFAAFWTKKLDSYHSVALEGIALFYHWASAVYRQQSQAKDPTFMK